MSGVTEKNVSLDTEEAKEEEIPKDAYWFVYILFFLVGVVQLLPWTFFVTAHDYWMYKFRDTSTSEVDSEHRTYLQTEFAPSLTISLQLSTILFLFLTLFFGHKITTNLKLFGPLSVILAAFVVAAIFIHVDTDDWQTGFFVLTMLTVAVINSMGAVFGMATYSVLANFPSLYLGAYLSGQGMAMIFTSLLQILSLAVGISTESSALVYFWLGIAVIAFSLSLMVVVSRQSQFYKYSLQKHHEIKKEMLNFREVLELLKKVWPTVTLMGFYLLTVTPVHTAITSLVVSEGEGSGEWNDVYFVPVITFLLPAVCEYIGRNAAVKLQFNIHGGWLAAFSALRMFIFVPLVVLCNAQPRHHLPVVFPHDYQYIIIMAIFSLTSGYLVSIASLIIPKLVPPEKLEHAFHVYVVGVGILLGLFSFISFFSVDVL